MSLYPAEIASYNAQKRRVRIKMIGLTDGDILLPEAELMYSMGDKSKDTEIEINVGDLVWVDFIAGDRRYPVIMGYRNPETGNSVGWRKWHHANIEMTAEGKLVLNANEIELNGKKSVKVKSGAVDVKGASTFHDSIAPDGGMGTTSGEPVMLKAGARATDGGDFETDETSLNEHPHKDSIGGTTTKPLKA